MKITSERKPDSQVLLEIDVEPERLEKSVDQAYRRLVGKYRIPGFRPGKAPRVMFERYVGRETLLREALERLVPEVYDEAVKEESLDPIDQPEFEIPTVEPLHIKATVPLRPKPDLKSYRDLRVEREETAVEPDEVDRSIEELRRRYATLQPVERPVQAGDIVRLDITATAEGRELLKETDADLRVTEEGTRGLPGLLEKLPGCEKGESYEFEVAVPDDEPDADVAGKTVSYQLQIKEVKEEQIPEPNDEFAKEVGEGFDNFAALHERIENDVRTRTQDKSDRDYEQKVLDSLIAQSNLEYPPVLVEREIDHVINEQTGGGSRANLDAALRTAGRSVAEYREELRSLAKDRVERSLVLTELARREGLAVSPDEVEAELDRLAGAGTPQYQRMRELFGTPSGLEFIERTLLTRKVFQRLRDITEGKQVPDPPVLDEPAADAASASDEAGGAPAEATLSTEVTTDAGEEPGDNAAEDEVPAGVAGASEHGESAAPGPDGSAAEDGRPVEHDATKTAQAEA